MEKFSIDEDEDETVTLNPIFLKALPKYVIEKGTVIERPLSDLYKCVYYKNRKGIMSLILTFQVKSERFVGFEDEYIYSYERSRSGFIVKEIWHLRRLLKIEIEKNNREKIKFFFINKSLNPADPLKIKALSITSPDHFLQKLKGQLENCDIDLIL